MPAGSMTRSVLLVIPLALSGGRPSPAHAASYAPPSADAPSTADAPSLVPVARIGGVTNAVAADPGGGYLFMGMGTTLGMVDVRDPARPRIVATSPPLDGPVRRVARVGDGLWVADDAGALWAFAATGASGPPPDGHPDLPAPIRLPLEKVTDVAVRERHAFVTTRAGGLIVFDVADPMRPVRVAQDAGLSYPDNVFATARHVFVTNGGVLRVFEYSAGELRLQGGVGVDGTVRAVYVDGTHAYVAERAALRIYDIASLSRIHLVASLGQMPPEVYGIQVRSGLAYLAAGTEGLVVLDVSRPDQPRALGQLRPPGAMEVVQVAVADDRAYLAAGDHGAWIVEVSRPDRPAGLGRVATAGVVDRVAVAGGYAIAAHRNRVRLVDVADPARPRLLGEYLAQADGDGYPIVEAMGPYAFVGLGQDMDARVEILERRSPGRLRHVASLPIPYLTDFKVRRGYLFAAPRFGDDLDVYDVADPLTPRLRGSLRPASYGSVIALDVDGDRAYLLESAGSPTFPRFTLQSVDVARPDAPRQLGRLDMDLSAGARGFEPGLSDVVVAGPMAYLSGAAGLFAVDVSDPAHPRQVTPRTLIDTAAGRVRIAGGRAYICTGGPPFALRVADAGRLAALEPLDAIPSHPVDACELEVTPRGDVFAAVGMNGMIVYRDGGGRGPRLSIYLPWAEGDR